MKPVKKIDSHNKEYMSKDNIPHVLSEMKPILLSCARKIHRPSFVDDNELVQEALIHIYENRDKYDDSKASIKTWCYRVALNKFYNLAKAYNTQKRTMKDEDGNTVYCTPFDETFHGEAFPDQEDSIYEQLLLDRTTKKLHKVAKDVLGALLCPPIQLVEMINKDKHRQQLREKHCEDRTKMQVEFHIDNESLATFLGVSVMNVIRAKDEIRYALKKSVIETEGNWPSRPQIAC